MSSSTIFESKAPLGSVGNILKFLARTLQIILGLTIAAISGVEIGHAFAYKGGWHHFFGFAVVVASFSVVAAVILCFPMVKSYSYFFIDGAFFFLWGVVSIGFGVAYLGKEVTPVVDGKTTVGPARGRMRAIAGLDFVVVGCWGYTWLTAVIYWWRLGKVVRAGREA